jgi:sulfur-oxidizing protein SoxA
MTLVFASLAVAAQAADAPVKRRSGFDYMSAETQAMQRDEMANPGTLWVLDGEALWGAKAGGNDKSCADCHGDAKQSMRGVAARYPAYEKRGGRAIDLAGRINACRQQKQAAEAFAAESKPLLSLEAYVANQSRDLPLAPPLEGRLAEARERGERRFRERIGQLDIACSQCHDDHSEDRIAGNPITQAMATGYPLYRLEWQTLGSLQRRIRGCMSAIRAEPLGYGSAEIVEIEAYLAWRARGLAVESPAVRP